MAGYDAGFWDSYADGNEARYNPEFAKFVRDLATSLRAASVLEVGCGTGIDLRLFPEAVSVSGIDLNDRALGIAREKMPGARFENASITKLPFGDSSVDFVFTHQLLNYIDDEALDVGVAELYRVAKKYVMNCEKFSESEGRIDDRHRGRNMLRRWKGYKVKVVSNVDMHGEIEPDRPRFTLLRKL